MLMLGESPLILHRLLLAHAELPKNDSRFKYVATAWFFLSSLHQSAILFHTNFLKTIRALGMLITMLLGYSLSSIEEEV